MMQNLNKPWPCGFKIGMRNCRRIGWTFTTALKNLKILYWWALFVQRIYVSARKFQRNYVSWHWRVYDAKFKGQLTCGLKNDIRNLESLHFDVLLFSIAYKVSTKKSIKELSLLTLKKDLNFEENCLFFWKMISEILWTLTRAVESL